MNTTVYLIRHGEVEYPLNDQGEKLVYGSDVPLSKLGQQQLAALGERFMEMGIELDALFVSPYLRARESARALISEWPTPPRLKTLHDLRDVDNPSWQGRTMKEYRKIGGDIYTNPLPGQETLEQLSQRALKEMRTIMENSMNYSRIGIVSHGDFLSAFFWMLTHEGVPPITYAEMKTHFYLEKGQAFSGKLDSSLRLVGEGTLITVEEVRRSIERWRK